MAQTLSKVMAGARLVIAAATPDTDPHIPFVAAPMHGELESLPFTRPQDATRKFHVLSGVMAGLGGPDLGNWNANEIHHFPDAIVIRVRYHCPLRRGGYGRLNDYMADDAQRILHALINASLVTWGGAEYKPQHINPAGGITITEVSQDGQADDFIMNYPIRVQTILGAV